MTNHPQDLAALCLVKTNKSLLNRLYEGLGDPVDSYWNGSHTWFGAVNDTEIEWRLHPVSNFSMPDGARPEELLQLALEEEVDPSHYWESLEVFTFDETELSVKELNEHISEKIGIATDASGYVDHETISLEFERTSGKVSITELLLAQLNTNS